MKRQLQSFIICLILLCSSFSCKKYLEEKSDKSLVVPEKISDFQALLDDAGSMNLEVTPSMAESSSDDFFLTDDSYSSNNETSRQTYLWSVKEDNFTNDWSYSYHSVYNANLCLQGIEKISRTISNSTAWDNVKGSALFYRAYSYLNLAWEYAKAYDNATAERDLGIVLREGADFNVKSTRSSVKETYDKIISDTRESISLLPSTPLNILRPSKAAACGLLARAYLSMRKYDSAYKYADLSLKEKSILIDYNDIDVHESSPFPRFDNPETIFFSSMNGDNYLHAPFQALTDTLLYASYGDNDLRKQAFFDEVNGYHSFKGNYSKNPYEFFSGIASDETILIRAECLARNNNLHDAENDFNLLLSKRLNNLTPFTPISFADKAQALDHILLERRKELLMRGLRWMDIKRLNKEGRNIIIKRKIKNEIYILAPNDDKYALPIPSDIIRITGMEQN